MVEKMTMPRTLGDTLKVWQMLVGLMIQAGIGIWWVAAQASEIKDLRKVSNLNTIEVVALTHEVVRIDIEGSRIWKEHRPEEIKNYDKLENKLISIEDRFNVLDRQMVRLLTLAEAAQKMKDK